MFCIFAQHQSSIHFFFFSQEKFLKFRIVLRNHGEVVAIKGYSGVCVWEGVGERGMGVRGGGGVLKTVVHLSQEVTEICLD